MLLISSVCKIKCLYPKKGCQKDSPFIEAYIKLIYPLLNVLRIRILILSLVYPYLVSCYLCPVLKMSVGSACIIMRVCSLDYVVVYHSLVGLSGHLTYSAATDDSLRPSASTKRLRTRLIIVIASARVICLSGLNVPSS